MLIAGATPRWAVIPVQTVIPAEGSRQAVIPAQAEIHRTSTMDSRLRGNDDGDFSAR